MHGLTKIVRVVVALVMLASPGFAQTIATFSDPVAIPPPFLFQYQDVTSNATIDGTLSGGYTGLGLDLIFPVLGFSVHPDVTFTVTDSFASPILGDINGIRFLPVGGGLGSLTFFEAAVPIFSASWNQLHFTTGTAGATDTTPGEVVAFTLLLPGAPALSNPESFAFSFSNQTGDTAAALAGNSATVQATAAFTSSATSTPIPEPSTVALLGLGVLGLAVGQVHRRAWGPTTRIR